MKNKIFKKTKQSGYTLIELLLVIAIIIALTALMVYALVSRANKQANIHETAAQVSAIVTANRQWITREGGTAMTTKGKDAWAYFRNYGLSSKISLMKGVNSNPFGGDYVFSGNIVKAGGGTGIFTIEITNVPASLIPVPKTKKTAASGNGTLVNAILRMTLAGHTSATDAPTPLCKSDAANTITCTFDT